MYTLKERGGIPKDQKWIGKKAVTNGYHNGRIYPQY